MPVKNKTRIYFHNAGAIRKAVSIYKIWKMVPLNRRNYINWIEVQAEVGRGS